MLIAACKQKDKVTDIIASDSTEIQWKHYGNDEGGMRYAQMVQINKDNAHKLREAWRYRTKELDVYKGNKVGKSSLAFFCSALRIKGLACNHKSLDSRYELVSKRVTWSWLIAPS